LEGDGVRRGGGVMPVGKRYRPTSLRRALYRRVLELRGMGLSYTEIRRRIFEEFGENLSKSTISDWTRRVHTPYGDGLGHDGGDRRRHKLRPCPELAYVIGARLGDGFTDRDKRRYGYMVCLAVKDYDFAEEFGRCAAIALGREKPYRPHWDKNLGRWVVRAYSRELYELLKRPAYLERIRPYVEHCRECIAAFLRGLADAEGSADECKVCIINSNPRLMEYAGSLLKALGVSSKTYKRREKEATKIDGRIVRWKKRVTYALVIHRKVDMIKFRQVVGFAIKRKQEVLERLR